MASRRSSTSALPPNGPVPIPATAEGVPAAESLSAQTAAGLVASFVDPALGKMANPAAWDPRALAWIPSGPAEALADA